MQRALFFDRDGTIIEDCHYLNDPQKIRYIPGAIKTLLKFKQNHFQLVMITNQAGVAKGLITLDQLDKIHQKIRSNCRDFNFDIDHIEYCPHSPDDTCPCRKPAPEMIHRASMLLDIDISNSFMVGDKWSDVMCGINAGCQKNFLVQSGQGKNEIKLGCPLNATDATVATQFSVVDSIADLIKCLD